MSKSPPDNGKRANTSYLSKAMNAPLLERSNEFELATRWQQRGDERALHTLIKSYTRLVVAIAVKFRHYGLALDDLIQEGNIGLMEAAKRFKPELGNRFSTYASWWVRAQIQDYVLRNWSIVRTGTTSHQKTLFFNLRRLRAKIGHETGSHFLTAASTQTIADELKVSPADVTAMEARFNGGDWSLNNKIGEYGDDEWLDTLQDQAPDPESILIEKKDGALRAQWLKNAIKVLTPREREIIKSRRLGEKPKTLEQLGGELGISKERVRQIEENSLGKLKNAILAEASAAGIDRKMLLN